MYFTQVLVALIGLGSASPAKEPPKKNDACPNACADEYTPVCGAPGPSDGGSNVTFGNKCVMEKYNCESKKCEFKAISSKNCNHFLFFIFILAFTVSSNKECEGKAPVRLS